MHLEKKCCWTVYPCSMINQSSSHPKGTRIGTVMTCCIKVGHVVLSENTATIAVEHSLNISTTHTLQLITDSCYVSTGCIRTKRDREGNYGQSTGYSEAVNTHTITQSQVDSVMHCLTDDYAVLYSGRHAHFEYMGGLYLSGSSAKSTTIRDLLGSTNTVIR
jgi:hypothetical protein